MAAMPCSRTPKCKLRPTNLPRRHRRRAVDVGVVRAREVGGAADQRRHFSASAFSTTPDAWRVAIGFWPRKSGSSARGRRAARAPPCAATARAAPGPRAPCCAARLPLAGAGARPRSAFGRNALARARRASRTAAASSRAARASGSQAASRERAVRLDVPAAGEPKPICVLRTIRCGRARPGERAAASRARSSAGVVAVACCTSQPYASKRLPTSSVRTRARSGRRW